MIAEKTTCTPKLLPIEIYEVQRNVKMIGTNTLINATISITCLRATQSFFPNISLDKVQPTKKYLKIINSCLIRFAIAKYPLCSSYILTSFKASF